MELDYNMNEWFKSILKKTQIGKKAVESGQYRAMLLACGGLAVNFGYAVYNGVFGVVYGSAWFVVMFTYYVILAFLRFYVVTYEFRGSEKRTERSVMRVCGIWLCLLAVVASGMVYFTISDAKDTGKHTIMMITVAAYTFWKAVMAVINIVKAHKQQAPLLITLRNVNCANAALSMLLLEHAMISTFGNSAEDFARQMDIATGAGVFVIVFGLGVGLILQSRFLKELSPEDPPENEK